MLFFSGFYHSIFLQTWEPEFSAVQATPGSTHVQCLRWAGRALLLGLWASAARGLSKGETGPGRGLMPRPPRVLVSSRGRFEWDRVLGGTIYKYGTLDNPGMNLPGLISKLQTLTVSWVCSARGTLG